MTTDRHHVPPRLTVYARANRRPLTPPEAHLWRHLRNRQPAGLKFRRQQVIGPYIADFVCFAARMVVELDGDSHVEQVDYDRKRTAWLRAQGFTVLRFNNGDVVRDVEAVLEAILLACEQRISPLTPDPSPATGRGESALAVAHSTKRRLSQIAPSPLAGEGWGEGDLHGFPKSNNEGWGEGESHGSPSLKEVPP